VDHFRLVDTAVARRPPGAETAFYRWFFESTAKCLNALYGRTENLWATEVPSDVKLPDGESQLAKLVYTLTNPVAAGLVERSRTWPGVHSCGLDPRQPFPVERPVGFFRAEGPVPPSATLEVKSLPAWAHLSREDYRALLDRTIAEREAPLAADRASARRTVLGPRRVLAQSPFDTPATHAPRRQISPRVASTNKWARIEALQRLKAFLEHYRRAWAAFRSGVRDAVFPPGTYAMRLQAGVCCAAPS